MTSVRTYAEIRERDKVLVLADQLVRLELGDEWTLEVHMARKAELLRDVDGGAR